MSTKILLSVLSAYAPYLFDSTETARREGAPVMPARGATRGVSRSLEARVETGVGTIRRRFRSRFQV